jgi:arylsulfatase A-like enzyme
MGTRKQGFIGALALVTAILATAGVVHAQAAADAPKPNVVVVFVDDLGWKDLGCYGSDFYETPNIDQLAGQGAVFSKAYSSCNVCSPTRASLMTGKYPQRVGFTSYLNPDKPSGANSAETYLPPSETTIGEAFRQAGYRTGYIGKWHVGSEEVGIPKQHGFDWQMATAKHGLPGSYFFFSLADSWRNRRASHPDYRDHVVNFRSDLEAWMVTTTDHALEAIQNIKDPEAMYGYVARTQKKANDRRAEKQKAQRAARQNQGI